MPTEHQPRMAPTPGCSFVARVAFDYGERHFDAGDPFPYAELRMTYDAACNFWRSAMISVAPEPVDLFVEKFPPELPAPAASSPQPKVTADTAKPPRHPRR